MATISTHNGSSARREHNIRLESVVSKEKHIDPNGHYEIWHDEKPQIAYERIFSDALNKYNERQSRPDRKIKNYYRHICHDEKKNPVYEMIIGVYGKKGEVSEETGKEIMRQFVATWAERNPNLEMIGAYYHADEEGQPHVHIDYIPVARNCSRGLETQNGLRKALEQQGFWTSSEKKTAQIAWQKRENVALEDICRSFGIEVEHPQAGKGIRHLDTDIYKANKKLDDLRGQIEPYEASMAVGEEILANARKSLFGHISVPVPAFNKIKGGYAAAQLAVEEAKEAKQLAEEKTAAADKAMEEAEAAKRTAERKISDAKTAERSAMEREYFLNKKVNEVNESKWEIQKLENYIKNDWPEVWERYLSRFHPERMPQNQYYDWNEPDRGRGRSR